jgi:hypothetical protein|nr:MAG TPA: hypothetical protein [Caudoviricetes sp.]
MVSTINRQPYQVKQLDYGDIKYKFFNHTNWKGVCDDKNYLGIDQETFADSKNVYVDNEGILKSRPSIKLRKKGIYGSIVDCWASGNFVVYQVVDSNKNYLTIYEIVNDVEHLINIRGGNVTNNTIPVDDKFKLVVANNKLYIFQASGLYSVNLLAQKDSEGIEFHWYEYARPYVPVTEYFVGGARTELEPKNVLTDKYISRYLYNKKSTDFGLNTSALIGETVQVRKQDNTLLGTLHDFKSPAEETIVDKLNFGMSVDSISGHRLFFANDTGIILIGDGAYNMYYSKDGRSFTALPTLEGAIGLAALSKSTDHVFAVLFKEDGPYAYTLAGGRLVGTTRVPYINWTKLVDFGSVTFNSSFAQGDFIDEALFAVRTSDTSVYTYEKGKLTQHVDSNSYSGLLSICCAEGYTSVIRNSTQTILYNDSNTSAPGFTITDRPTSGLDSWNTFKQQYTNKSVTLAYVKGMNYTDDGAVEFKTIFVSDDDIVNHSATIPDTQKTERTVNFGTFLGGPTGAMKTADYYLALSSGLKVVTKSFFIVGDTVVLNMLQAYIPLAFAGDNFYANDPTSLTRNAVTSNLAEQVYLDVEHDGDDNIIVFDYEAELEQYFISKGKNLYISAIGSFQKVDDFKWYFPEINTQEFDYDITNLHPISATELAVFLKDSIYYVKPVKVTRNEIESIAYTYYKSRIPLGCENGSDVITSYDNKYTMFVTKRGFVAMSYQDFISSEEQALTFLSDTVYDVFSKWNKGAIKLFQYNFWIILYRLGTADAFVFDMRSNSWWPVAYNSNVVKLIEINRIPLILKGQYLYQFDKDNDNYFDGNSIETGRIDWHITSQKLHLSAINYYKHIINLTFFGYNYDSKQAEMRFNLRIINYRKQTDTNEQKSFEEVEYKIQLTRTFVKRINYYKVNQVQYVLESCRDIDEEDKTPIPLSLTCISLKYLITGQVR